MIDFIDIVIDTITASDIITVVGCVGSLVGWVMSSKNRKQAKISEEQSKIYAQNINSYYLTAVETSKFQATREKILITADYRDKILQYLTTQKNGNRGFSFDQIKSSISDVDNSLFKVAIIELYSNREIDLKSGNMSSPNDCVFDKKRNILVSSSKRI